MLLQEAGTGTIDSSYLRAQEKTNMGNFAGLTVDIQRNVHCLVYIRLWTKSLRFQKVTTLKSHEGFYTNKSNADFKI